jgi:hypothetical protein
MNIRIAIGIMFLLLVNFAYGQAQDIQIPLAPKENRRSENYQLQKSKYSLDEMKSNFSEELMRVAASQYEKVSEVNEKGKWKPTP